jgi:hypothetical protein
VSVKVPYLRGRLREQTARWAWEYGADLVELDSSDEAYWRALCQWWIEPGDLVVVEQDIVPAEGVVDEMLGCEQPWCSSAYDIGGIEWGWGLGCAKFSYGLRARYMDLAVQAGDPYHDPEPKGAWWQLDTRLSYRLVQRGVLPHGHERSRHLRVEGGDARA